MSPFANECILSQAKYRFVQAFSLFGILAILFGVLFFQAANMGAVDTHRINANRHYIKVMADLERQWGRAAFNLKIRLESENFFGGALKNNDKLLTYLTAQGGSIDFPSLRIEDAKGGEIISYEYVPESLPKVIFLPGQEVTWVLNTTKNQLFLVIRQLIWLGKENGYLLLFRPMDHALLNHISYPDTRLSLWWNEKPVASSEGEQGLTLAELNFQNLAKDRSVLFLSWAGIEAAKSPKLFVETTSPPLFGFPQLAVVLAVIFVLFLFACWSTLGIWGLRNIGRIQALNRAQKIFQATHKVDGTVVKEFELAHAYLNDEISSVTLASEQMMRSLIVEDQKKG